MALWDCSMCSLSWGSSPIFPPPHKGCSRPAVPRGHRAVTRGKRMSSELDLFSLPSPFLPLWSTIHLPCRLISCSVFGFVFFFSVSIQKLVLECRRSWKSSVAQQCGEVMGQDQDAVRSRGLRRGGPTSMIGMQETSHGGVWQALPNFSPW